MSETDKNNATRRNLTPRHGFGQTQKKKKRRRTHSMEKKFNKPNGFLPLTSSTCYAIPKIARDTTIVHWPAAYMLSFLSAESYLPRAATARSTRRNIGNATRPGTCTNKNAESNFFACANEKKKDSQLINKKWARECNLQEPATNKKAERSMLKEELMCLRATL